MICRCAFFFAVHLLLFYSACWPHALCTAHLLLLAGYLLSTTLFSSYILVHRSGGGRKLPMRLETSRLHLIACIGQLSLLLPCFLLYCFASTCPTFLAVPMISTRVNHLAATCPTFLAIAMIPTYCFACTSPTS
jgi:hypothetical protein